MSTLNEVLESLHELTANQLAEILTKGIPVVNQETGEVTRVPASAAYFTAAIALLKHNGIQAKVTKKNGLGKLAGAVADLPTNDNVMDLVRERALRDQKS